MRIYLRKPQQWAYALSLIAVTITIIGCSSGASSQTSATSTPISSAPAANITGTWVGADSSGYTDTYVLNQSSSSITGEGTAIFGDTFKITGSISGLSVKLTIHSIEANCDQHGILKLTPDHQKMSGTLLGCNNDSYTLSLVKQGTSSSAPAANITGTWVGPGGGNTDTYVLVQKGSSITGEVTFASSGATLPITGSIVDVFVHLTVVPGACADEDTLTLSTDYRSMRGTEITSCGFGGSDQIFLIRQR